MEDDAENGRTLFIFGRDVSQIPCFRESFMTGILSGMGIGLIAFLRTSKPPLATHVAFGSFMLTTMGYWSVCRYNWSVSNFQNAQLQAALQKKILMEGTSIEKELEEKGVLKSA